MAFLAEAAAMGTVINLKNVEIGDNARVLNSAAITGSASIGLDSVTINGDAVVLDNLNIQDFCQEIKRTETQMTPEEYSSIQALLRQQSDDRSAFLKSLKNHLVSFAEGIAASIVAGCLMK